MYSAPNYNRAGPVNNSADLALLELEKKVEFNSLIKPTCLITEDMNFDYSQYELYVAGYGPGHFVSDEKKLSGTESE